MQSWQHDQDRLKVKQRYAFIGKYKERLFVEEQARLRAIKDEKVKRELRRRKRARQVQDWRASIANAAAARRERNKAAMNEFDEIFVKKFEDYVEKYRRYVTQVVTDRAETEIVHMSAAQSVELDRKIVRKELKVLCRQIEKEVKKSDEYHDKTLTILMAQDKIIEVSILNIVFFATGTSIGLLNNLINTTSFNFFRTIVI
jgi:hypothetical protein